MKNHGCRCQGWGTVSAQMAFQGFSLRKLICSPAKLVQAPVWKPLFDIIVAVIFVLLMQNFNFQVHSRQLFQLLLRNNIVHKKCNFLCDVWFIRNPVTKTLMVNPFMAKKSWSFLKHIQAQINKTSFEKFYLTLALFSFLVMALYNFNINQNQESKIATHFFSKFKAYN